jgi:hypothetical protein
MTLRRVGLAQPAPVSRAALASRPLDTRGRVPVRPARLALRPGDGEDRADLRAPPILPPSRAPECAIAGAPPCPGDRPGLLPMPLASARLRPDGIEPSAETTAGLTPLAAAVRRELAPRQARAAAARRARENPARPPARPPVTGSPDASRENRQLLREHEAFRCDAFPPWTDPDT